LISPNLPNEIPWIWLHPLLIFWTFNCPDFVSSWSGSYVFFVHSQALRWGGHYQNKGPSQVYMLSPSALECSPLVPALPFVKYEVKVIMNLNIGISWGIGGGKFLCFLFKNVKDITPTPTSKHSHKISNAFGTW